MPRNYQRKAPERIVVTDDQLEAARLLISNGISKRKAAEKVGLKESTLRKRLKAGKTAGSMGRFSTTFTKPQEDEIYEYLKRSDDLYYGLTMISLRKLVYEFADLNKVPHRFNISSKLVGRDWVYGFLKRYPELKLRQPTPTSIARAMGFNKTQVKIFYNNLQDLYKKHNFAPSRIYNMDESGVNTVPKKIPKVISVKGKKQVGKIVSAERGQTITLVCAMSATGNFVPPVFIFPRKRMQGYLLNNAPEGSIGVVSDSGFINTDLFIDFLRHFKDNVQPTKDNPVLLILDNHSSHISLASVNFCRDNGIHMLTIPPHSSHKMQPLDRGFFGPLKIKFAYECDKWLSHHPGRVIGQTEVAHLVNEAFQKVASLSNAVSGFKVSGIWPLDTDIFSDEDFAAAFVTDMTPASNTKKTAEAECSNTQDAKEPEQESPLLCLTVPTSIEPRVTSPSILSQEMGTSLSESITDVTMAIPPNLSPPIHSAPSTSKEHVALSTIQALPKVTLQNRRRKGKKSIIATESPTKLELEEKKKAEEENLAKKKVRLNLKRKLTTKKTAMKKTETKTITKKTKTVRNMIKENDENDYFCPLCGEKYIYPPNEDWIKCSLCESWWHEQCTSISENDNFVCDYCNKSF